MCNAKHPPLHLAEAIPLPVALPAAEHMLLLKLGDEEVG
jgi:hypothetical protein